MIVLCIKYCIPLAIFVYYMLGPMIIIGGVFAVKRGLRTRRASLRQAAFIAIFASLIKMCLFDVRMIAEGIKNKLCGLAGSFPGLYCGDKGITPHEKNVLGFMALVLLVVGSVVLLHFYQKYMPDRKLKEYTPEQVRLRLWVNGTFYLVIVMALWVVAPWVGAIFQAALPHIFVQVTWKEIASACIVLLLIDFWKVESVVWERSHTDTKAEKKRRRHLHNTWSSRDTLWMTLFLFLLTSGLSYVANDVLSAPDPNEKSDQVNYTRMIPNVDTRNPYHFDDSTLGR
jgi:hypothetical protein